MRDLSNFLIGMGAVLVPVIILILLIELALHSRKLGRFFQWLNLRYEEFANWFSARRKGQPSSPRKSDGQGSPSAILAHSEELDPTVAQDARALFLHEVELGTNRPLLVSFAGEVYVDKRHRKQINNYLRRTGWSSAAEAFNAAGYRLLTAKR